MTAITTIFILRARKAKTSASINLNNLHEEGRLDIVANCVVNALSYSNTIRKDTKIHIILEGPPNPPVLITYDGSKLVGIEPHERAVAASIKQALQAYNKDKQTVVSPGLTIEKNSFEQLVKDYIKQEDTTVYYLHEKGDDIRSIEFSTTSSTTNVFVFGDMLGMPPVTEKLLARLGAKRLSLGPNSLYASHCVVLVQNEFDRR